jgi:hypothetical protein
MRKELKEKQQVTFSPELTMRDQSSRILKKMTIRGSPVHTHRFERLKSRSIKTETIALLKEIEEDEKEGI